MRVLYSSQGVPSSEVFQPFAHTEYFNGPSLGAHRGGAKFCSAVHIQGSMLMRIIIKRCRVGIRLLQSALRQKQEGQRQRVRKAALLNALLDLISFGHFQHQAKPRVSVSFYRLCHTVSNCNVSGLPLKNLLDFTVIVKATSLQEI